MTILDQGAALFFTRNELADAQLLPETLTEQEALSLIRHTLRQAGKSIPPQLEVFCFPSPCGVLFFLRSRTEDLPPSCCFSVTFS